ncbi:hypothetical protein K2173_026219 [Erythroxylum novogranatense]|uniref:Homeobox domain-containing protein n=1 Tax=Erythroxylum novogranatense TaxID=1862640 RepID=A0AAV8SBZ8_9ROSI|nr:hypothetical protein K2173_026219 [Erythroxylum novogranatense]
MEMLNTNLEEIEIGTSASSFQRFLHQQRELFHSQIDQLQSVVVTQCQLTGVNPLSQEMAAGALSIKIGKRPRDLLNPKAVKYMQAVFSIKDAISKKESREISAQFGITVTQVRDFFASQRTRVRKIVRLSREKAIRASASKETQDGVPTSSDPTKPINPIPLNSIGADAFPLNSIIPSTVPLNSIDPAPVPLNSVGPPSVEGMPSCSLQDGALPDLDDLEKHFVDNIFNLLRKEETFSGQMKLMEWILRIQNPSVLDWFLSKGAVMILVTWLSQAAAEEQTSVVLVTLKALCHLPLHKTFPEHMSAILQTVNSLRFYRAPDISNRARVLLARWSKIFARSQATRKPNGIRSQEMILKQSIDEIMGNEVWQPNSSPGNVPALSSEILENVRKMDSSQEMKLLPATIDDPSRKHTLGMLSHSRERRKVQLVEQPGQKAASRSSQASKAVPVSQSRPMSTDDIQKAKMRALFMQGKYGKTGSSSTGNNGIKTEGLSRYSNASSNILSVASKVSPQPKKDENKKSMALLPKVSDKSEDSKDKMATKDPTVDLYSSLIPWRVPAEIKLINTWRVGNGENSKEVDFQRNRNRREMETKYRAVSEIPSNPKEPWDLEMDHDDSLTPEIPIEQPPDADSADVQISHNQTENKVVASEPVLPQMGSGTEPDLELLAVLLKNPELVFALTSGQSGNLSNEDTIKLLDMIKKGGAGLNGVGGNVEEKVEVSLPSPTPPSKPGTSGWAPEVDKNPFSKQRSAGTPVTFTDTGVPTVDKLTGFVQPRMQASGIRVMQNQLRSLPLQQTLAPMPSSSHQSLPSNSVLARTPTSEMAANMKNATVTIHSIENYSTAREETSKHIRPSPTLPFAANPPEIRSIAFPLSPTPTPTAAQMSTPVRSSSCLARITEQPVVYSSRLPTADVGQVPDCWRSRQGGLTLNSLSRANQSNHDASFGRALQPQIPSLPSWDRNEHLGDEVFESWSPENSPDNLSDQRPGRNYPGRRSNSGWEYMPDNRSRQRYQGHNRNINRRFR